MIQVYDFEFVLRGVAANSSQIKQWVLEDLGNRHQIFEYQNHLICLFSGQHPTAIHIQPTLRRDKLLVLVRGSSRVTTLDRVRLIAQDVFCSLERRGLQVEYLRGREWHA